ncbi:MAG TPA: IclR family transcriptional regulator [Xanthobacteraceae bacterium]
MPGQATGGEAAGCGEETDGVPKDIARIAPQRAERGDSARRSEGTSIGTGGKDRRFVTALARGLMILRAFENSSDQLGNVEIARRTGLPKPTVSRLTHTLTKLGYLSSVGERERYQLGISLMALGMAFFRANSFPQIAQPFLQELADQVQCNVALFVRERLECLLVKLFIGVTQNIAVRLDVGARVPVGDSITGMAMIAALPPDDRERLIAELRSRPSRNARLLQARIKRCQDELQRKGYAVGIGIWHQDINTVTAPIIAQDTGELFAVSVSGPSYVKTERVLNEEVGPRLVAVIHRLRNLDLGEWPPSLRLRGPANARI